MISWDICKERYTCADSGHFHTEYSKVHFPTTNLRIMQVYSLHITRPLRIPKKYYHHVKWGVTFLPFFGQKKASKSFLLYSPYKRHAIFITLCTLGPRAYWFYELCVVFRSDFLATYTQKVAETPRALSFCIDMHGQLAALKILPREAFTDHPK